MKKKLSERVEEHTKQREKPLRNSIALFITANRGEVIQALKQGHTIKAIWETLSKEKRLKCTYQAFQQQLNNQIKPKESKNIEPPILAAKIPKGDHAKRQGFVFNAKPNAEELY